jgi:hypothetical protein
LRAKLEFDLGVSLDGVPLAKLNPVALYHGIRIHTPVSLDVPNPTGKPVEGVSMHGFKSKFLTMFYKEIESKFYDKAGLESLYALKLKSFQPKDAENPKQGLETVSSKAKAEDRLIKGENIAQHTTIIVNHPMIESAKVEEVSNGKETTFNLSLTLTDEGANRLWKYSAEHNDRIIVVCRNVPIAAASVGTQLSSKELVIKQIADRTLVEDAISLLKSR